MAAAAPLGTDDQRRLHVRNLTRRSELGAVRPATSFRDRFVGLMGRRELAPGDGLWFPGTTGIHMLFMRFAIDAVYLSRADGEGARRVVSIRPGLRPWTGVVWVVRGADGVLELPDGTAAATGTAVGDLVRLDEPG